MQPVVSVPAGTLTVTVETVRPSEMATGIDVLPGFTPTFQWMLAWLVRMVTPIALSPAVAKYEPVPPAMSTDATDPHEEPRFTVEGPTASADGAIVPTLLLAVTVTEAPC